MTRSLLALGGDLKGAFAIDGGETVFSSPHGDLSEEEAFEAWRGEIEAGIDRREIEGVAMDLHPLYRSRAYGIALARRLGVPAIEIQHHHAHAEAVLAEHNAEGPSLALILDGTGFGTDGSIWGCEVLHLPGDGTFHRVGHLFPVPAPGGDALAREPWRMTVAWLRAAGFPAPTFPNLAREAGERNFAVAWARAAIGTGMTTTSAGRLFDAAAGLLGFGARAAEEAGAARALEAAAVSAGRASAFPYEIHDGVLDMRPAFGAMAMAFRREASPERLAAAFHETIAKGLVELVQRVAVPGARTVACAGGCFLNRILAREIPARLERAGFRPLLPRKHPPTDLALPLGQIRAARLSRRAAAVPA